jgi:hypothetical protein
MTTFRDAIPAIGLGGLAGVTSAMLAAGQGGLLAWLFPAMATALGLVLLVQRPLWFYGLCWWLWFLTPGLRRLCDWQAGWNPTNPIMLAPIAVTALVALDLLLRPSPGRRALFPFVVAGCGVAYAFFVGLFQAGPAAATYDMVGYMLPIAFAAAIVAKPERLGALREATRGVFAWGLLVTGVYGVCQYVLAPAWDVAWMLEAPINSVGAAEPFGVRVFSTLNAPQPFAMVMMAGLLLLLARPGKLGPFAGVAAAGALVLSLVRSAWGGWIVGAAYLLVRAGAKARARAAMAAVVLMVAAAGATAAGFESEIVADRIASVRDLMADESAQDRFELYANYAEEALFQGVGAGLGSVGLATKLSDGDGPMDLDSGLLAGLYTMGWPGVTLYLAGLVMAFARAVKAPADPYQAAGVAVALAIGSQLVFSNVLMGVSGLMMWGFLALAASGPAAEASPPAGRPA